MSETEQASDDATELARLRAAVVELRRWLGQRRNCPDWTTIYAIEERMRELGMGP